MTLATHSQPMLGAPNPPFGNPCTSGPRSAVHGEVPTPDDATGTLPWACRCGARWAGIRTAHCAGTCHQTFSSPAAFDEHRVDGECHDPATRNLVLTTRAGYQVWSFPPDEEATARLRALKTRTSSDNTQETA
jgi:hypothetical protein